MPFSSIYVICCNTYGILPNDVINEIEAVSPRYRRMTKVIKYFLQKMADLVEGRQIRPILTSSHKSSIFWRKSVSSILRENCLKMMCREISRSASPGCHLISNLSYYEIHRALKRPLSVFCEFAESLKPAIHKF